MDHGDGINTPPGEPSTPRVFGHAAAAAAGAGAWVGGANGAAAAGPPRPPTERTATGAEQFAGMLESGRPRAGVAGVVRAGYVGAMRRVWGSSKERHGEDESVEVGAVPAWDGEPVSHATSLLIHRHIILESR